MTTNQEHIKNQAHFRRVRCVVLLLGEYLITEEKLFKEECKVENDSLCSEPASPFLHLYSEMTNVQYTGYSDANAIRSICTHASCSLKKHLTPADQRTLRRRKL